MAKIEAELPGFYRDMHANNLFLGQQWRKHVSGLGAFSPLGVVLDYGCGPRGGLARYRSEGISYDPYIAEFSEDPWKKSFHTLFSCDVLEHMTLSALVSFCNRLVNKKSCRLVYLVVSTRKANKVFPNGVNVHLTVKPHHWWEGFLEGRLSSVFEMAKTSGDLTDQRAVFVFKRRRVEKP